MLCELCQKQEAVVHVTWCNGYTGEMTKRHFCQGCATHPDGAAISPEEMRRGRAMLGLGDTRTDEQ